MLSLRVSAFPFSRTRMLFVGRPAAAIAAVVLIGGVLWYEAYAPPQSEGYRAGTVGAVPAGTAYLSRAAQTAALSRAVVKEPMREVHIANNGLILLRGARVLWISGGVIHVGMDFGSSDLTWAAATKNNSNFLRQDDSKGSIGDIAVGDVITITGTLTRGGAEPIIDALYVREQ